MPSRYLAFTLVLSSCCVSSIVHAQDARPDSAATIDALIAIDRALNAATVRKDGAALERIYAPNFVLVSRRGDVWTRQRNLEFLLADSVQFDSMASDRYEVRLFGATAHMYHFGSGEGRIGSRSMRGSGYTFHVFAKRDTSWQLVLTHEGVSPPPTRPPDEK